MAINFGSTGAISASFLARDNGYWVAYLVPTCIFATVPIVLYFGRNSYVKTPPRGSIVLETFRVIGLCLSARATFNPVALIRDLRRPGFWDPAKPSASPS
jgi:POT family proton-dependent oligopeptide transporter